MFPYISVLLSGALLLVAGGSLAQDAGSDPLRADARLDRRVMVRAEGISLRELLARIQEKTSVRLAAAREAAEEKVVVFGPERPLRELLADLAALLNDRWTKDGHRGSEPGYLLTKEPRATQYEAKLERAAIERLLARMAEQVRALAETPEQLARRPEKDLIRKFLSDPDLRFPTELYAAMGRDQREALFVRRRLNILFSALHPQHQEPLRKALGERVAQMEEFVRTDEQFRKARETGQPILGLEKVRDLNRSSLRFRVQNNGGRVIVIMALGVAPIRTDVQQTEDGRNQLSASLGCWPLGIFDGAGAWILPPHGDPYARTDVPSGAAVPAIEATRDAASAKSWVDRLRRLAECSGQPVLADYYRCRPVVLPPDEPATGTDPKIAALDELCRPAGYLWWVRGSSLLLRKRDWFHQRRFEVPDAWLDAAVASRRGSDPVLLSDALRLLELTPEQIAGLDSLRTGSFSSESDGLASIREALALFRSNPGGTSRPIPRVFPGGPRPTQLSLTFRGLTPLQRSVLPALLERQDRPLAAAEIEAFSSRVTAAAEEASAGGYRAVPVNVEWSFGGDPIQVPVGLPLAFPEDRRAATVVEPAPAGR